MKISDAVSKVVDYASMLQLVPKVFASALGSAMRSDFFITHIPPKINFVSQKEGQEYIEKNKDKKDSALAITCHRGWHYRMGEYDIFPRSTRVEIVRLTTEKAVETGNTAQLAKLLKKDILNGKKVPRFVAKTAIKVLATTPKQKAAC